MKIKYVFVSWALLAICLGLNAQNQNDAYREFLKQRNKEFKDWRQKANNEFVEYLKQAWEEFSIHDAKEDPDGIGAVPDEPEYFSGAPDGTQSHGVPSDVGMALPAVLDYVRPSSSYNPANEVVSVDFYGVKYEIPFDEGMRISIFNAREKEFAEVWEAMKNAQYMPIVESINKIIEDDNLGDWATYMLIKFYSEAIYDSEKNNERISTQMFLLSQLEYTVRVGARDNQLLLLMPAVEPIVRLSYVTSDNIDYYLIGSDKVNIQGNLLTFPQNFPGAKKTVSLKMSKPMTLGGTDTYRNVPLLKWSSLFDEDISVPVNTSYISFTYDYPVTSFKYYHKCAVDNETSKAILRQVKYKVLSEGMNEAQAVSFILKLVQTGFDYKTDMEMFGREKPLFIEESLYYKANNCKDRVLIFSWLIRNVVGLKTVLMGYPGHIACGVEFSGDNKYTICDPTYINAPVGMVSPKSKGVTPVIIEL